ncbi:MAG: hypothetical protein K6T31_02905 [Alicyclobacillus sp.]|nr:hypothetical protein [Alicyclobacillus sp.]
MARSVGSVWVTFQVACAYVGTVVGAGFASGQEVFQFFVRYGAACWPAIVLATVLFGWLGSRVLCLGAQLQVHSLREWTARVLRPRLCPWVDAAVLAMLFGVSVAMLAGAGALFAERLHLSFQWGALLTLMFAYVTVLGGVQGLLHANAFIVPVMAGFALYAGGVAGHNSWVHGWGDGLNLAPLAAPGTPWAEALRWVGAAGSALLYGAFNIGLAAGVLLPVGAEVGRERILRAGAWLGATVLGMMLAAVALALHVFSPQALAFHLPLAYVASRLGAGLQWLYVFVLWAEIFSTLVGDVFACIRQVGVRSRQGTAVAALFVLALAFACSQVGFSAVIRYAYPVFGWVSAALLAALLWPREKLPGT